MLFERTRSPLTWRAALAAEAYARGSARWWRRNAAELAASSRAAGQVTDPRPAALTTEEA